MGHQMSFEKCLKQISTGNQFDEAELVSYLVSESIERRARINYQLAEAFFSARQYGKAKVFIDRAWDFSDFSDGVFELYKNICEHLNDFDALRAAYKRIGLRYTKEGRIDQALTAFNNWQYVYATYLHVDRYQYDIDILEAIKQLAKPYQLGNGNQPVPPMQGRRIRLAYLVYGASHASSVLVKILGTFAKFHDQTAFDVSFFVPENLSLGQRSRTSKLLGSNGATFHVASWSYKDDSLVTFANSIQEFRPDILITTAGLAAFEHYFLALLRPAPLVISLLQGPPQQFTARGFDHAISWSQHPLIDSPIDTSLVKLGVHLPDPARIPSIARKEIGIPDDAIILMSAGRYVKFQNREFWQNLVALLRAHPKANYVVVGAERSQVPYISNSDTDLIDLGRIRFLGWRKDCLGLLNCTDIVVDTYPSGGGHVLIDAMALGKPFVSFRNDYLHAFDQTDWSVAEEFVAIPELIVPRGDFEKFNEVIAKLISDTHFRNEMGDKCYRQIRLEMPTEKEGVLSLEKEYMRLLNTKGQQVNRSNSAEIVVQKKTKSRVFHKGLAGIKKLIKHVLT